MLAAVHASVQAAVVAGHNAKLSIFATRLAIYSHQTSPLCCHACCNQH